MGVAARLFSGRPAIESVSTSVCFPASPEMVWRQMLMYEEVSVRPPLILRALLPIPMGTEGDKSRVGASIRCEYREGDLMKRITVVEPPHLLEFEVVRQRLGFEGCVTALGGSYRIEPSGDRTEVTLTTNYHGYLQPRMFWHPAESFVAHLFHRHILAGMRGSLPDSSEKSPCTTS
jgi:hypothetical protein